MTNRTTTLSVAIPCYKRPEYLERCIRSVFSSVKSSEVNIFVCDDSLDDTNNGVYACFAEEISAGRLIVIRNEKNLGIDANICACIERADSEYVWLIGEDDLMKESGIATALDFISMHPAIPFIFANYSYITSDQTKTFRDRSVDLETGTVSSRKFVENYLWSAGFIGGCIFRRDNFLNTKYKNFIGTYYAHVAGLVLSTLGVNIGVIAEPLVGNRVGSAETFTWSSDSFGVFQGWRRLLSMLRQDIGDDTYHRAYQNHQDAHGYFSWRFLINKKADGVLSGYRNASDTGPVSAEELKRAWIVQVFVPRSFCLFARRVHGAVLKPHLQSFSL